MGAAWPTSRDTFHSQTRRLHTCADVTTGAVEKAIAAFARANPEKPAGGKDFANPRRRLSARGVYRRRTTATRPATSLPAPQEKHVDVEKPGSHHCTEGGS